VKPIFEWDRRKDSANFEKHGVSFSEASAVFGDPLARIFADEGHSADERREIISLTGEAASGGVFHRAGGWQGADR
jgi:uncharacterized DUF497 family protein